ncbi:hypothetical protein BJY01DRAFT_225226 [Aspergillus pseudoustus]|uniref:NAD(P)-binding protein n=1 Tax=Aspergillus pseudoustus TaxID=1810923 RepID=A0ABR4J0A6_9EURO
MLSSNEGFTENTTAIEAANAFAFGIKDKIILITGPTVGGIGFETALGLARHSPELLILAGRSAEKINACMEKIREENPGVSLKSVVLDLLSQESCRHAAVEILNAPDVPKIDILINNAGVMCPQTLQFSPEGIESQFAANHIGHFLFTNLILPKIIQSANSASSKGSTRIINVSSLGCLCGPVRFSDINCTKMSSELPQDERPHPDRLAQFGVKENQPYTPMIAYGQSKTANILFSVHLKKLLWEKHGILSLALHPGAVRSNLGRHLGFEEVNKAFQGLEMMGLKVKSTAEGASTTVVSAFNPKLSAEDIALSDCQPSTAWVPDWALDGQKAQRLWDLSEQLVGQGFVW